MRQWQVIPKGVVFDQSGAFRGKLLEAFCRNLGMRLIHASPQHPQTNGKLERAFHDDMPEFYRHQPVWELEALRRALPAYVEYRNEVRGHRAQGAPGLTRLAEQHRMAVPWVLDSLEQYARYPMMQKRVTPRAVSSLFRRQIYLDPALRDQWVTCCETVEAWKSGGTRHRVSLLREYRRWQNRYWWNWGRELPRDLCFERYTPCVSVDCCRIMTMTRYRRADFRMSLGAGVEVCWNSIDPLPRAWGTRRQCGYPHSPNACSRVRGAPLYGVWLFLQTKRSPRVKWGARGRPCG